MVQDEIQNLKIASNMIAISIGTAVLISLVYFIFLRICAGVIVWLLILIWFAGLGAFSAVLYTGKGFEIPESV